MLQALPVTGAAAAAISSVATAPATNATAGTTSAFKDFIGLSTKREKKFFFFPFLMRFMYFFEKPKSTTVKNYPIEAGTNDFRIQPAMSSDQLIAALEIGAQSAERLVAGGSRTLCTGEVGIGNTTSSAILIASFCSAESNKVTGYGSGIPEDIFQSKLNIVTSALNQSKLLSDPLEILAKYGGFEIAALVGFIIRAATLKVPIILDGVITLAAAVAANKIRPGISKNLIAGHCSAEPASAIAIKHLSLEPILDLDLRLGEGTGAVLAIPIIRAACNMTKNMGELKDYL